MNEPFDISRIKQLYACRNQTHDPRRCQDEAECQVAILCDVIERTRKDADTAVVGLSKELAAMREKVAALESRPVADTCDIDTKVIRRNATTNCGSYGGASWSSETATILALCDALDAALAELTNRRKS